MRIFIAHASEQKRLATQIAVKLRTGEHTAFLDADSLPPGDTYDDRIRVAVEQCDVFVFLLSSESVTPGKYSLTELGYAKKRWPNPKGRILPVLADDTDLSGVDPYLTAVTVLRPVGAAATEVLFALDAMHPREVQGPGQTISLVPPIGLRAALPTVQLSRIHWAWVTLISMVALATLGVAIILVNDVDVPLESMGLGTFNVAVAALEANGDLDASDGVRIADSIARAMSFDEDQDRYLVWGPAKVGTVSADSAQSRAADLNADVLVYGDFAVDAVSNNVYAANLRILSAQHSERAPWPIAVDETASLTITRQQINDGSAETERSIQAVAFTLDGLAALLADNVQLAEQRLDAAEEERRAENRWAIIPALRAWTLLTEAAMVADAERSPELVARARGFADLALDREPASELANIVSLSVDYLSIIPVPSPFSLDCNPPQEPVVLPNLVEVQHLSDDVSAFQARASDIGRIQTLSIQGRLSISEALLTESASLDEAFLLFEDVLGRSTDNPALSFWASDAHRWLGRLSFASDAPIPEVAQHFLRAIDIDSPYWLAHDYSLAGWAHECFPERGGSRAEAACLYESAIRFADADQVEIVRDALSRVGESCPPD